ncbi:Ldh family oxidoreductase [Paenactinomyces guangxiensis]|uniref:Ldh family oxidoreductase n=1 Tax=Paenactinomyces guangxiensis TaxID=1490290 RepID=A0A7W2A9X9_9BACL|nr:Ldh family oxidoreductase [Paenactinomyces guangxiensis]MBA4495709.1 Ldh family oxidoreductase [Paenactinomyces guangxiensis]MBH8592698.1 Ldh family oxidoreductase [Paenactinomyces guangxiensis]
MPNYQPQELINLAVHILESIGVPQEDAAVVADALVQADLEGISSHGISRLSIYARRMMEKRIETNPNIHIERAGNVLKVDGGNGLGHVVTFRAIQAAIPLAKQEGIAAIAVRNSNHNGTASYYCRIACKEEIILIGMTNSPPGIVPTGGKKAFLGTNPIAFGFPARTSPPIIVDMSTSVAARGKIILAAKQGEKIPAGWAVDREGLITTDAKEALSGAVLPFGGAKGYALATAIELLTGVLSGAAFGPHVQNIYDDKAKKANVGHTFFLLHIPHWMPMEGYYRRVEQFVEELKSAPKAGDADEIYYPGERRYQRYLETLHSGISLSDEVWEELKQLAAMYGIPVRRLKW